MSERNKLAEKENIELAQKLAAKKMRDDLEGVKECPASIITYYLGLSGDAGELERKRKKASADVMEKKAENLAAQTSSDSTEEAIEALLKYRGS